MRTTTYTLRATRDPSLEAAYGQQLSEFAGDGSTVTNFRT